MLAHVSFDGGIVWNSNECSFELGRILRLVPLASPVYCQDVLNTNILAPKCEGWVWYE